MHQTELANLGLPIEVSSKSAFFEVIEKRMARVFQIILLIDDEINAWENEINDLYKTHIGYIDRNGDKIGFLMESARGQILLDAPMVHPETGKATNNEWREAWTWNHQQKYDAWQTARGQYEEAVAEIAERRSHIEAGKHERTLANRLLNRYERWIDFFAAIANEKGVMHQVKKGIQDDIIFAVN